MSSPESRSLSQPSSPKRDSGLASSASAASSVRPSSSAIQLEDLEPGGVAPTSAHAHAHPAATPSSASSAPATRSSKPPSAAKSMPAALDQAAAAAESGGASSSLSRIVDDFTPIVVTVAKDLPGQTGVKNDDEDEEEEEEAKSNAGDSFTTAASTLTLNKGSPSSNVRCGSSLTGGGDFCKICHCGGEAG